MRRLSIAVIAAASTVAFTQIASAADLPRKAPAPPPPPIAFNWTGFYVGGHAGYMWVNSSDEITSATPNSFIIGQDIPSSIPLDPKGFIGGGQVGYNWQSPGSRFVYGLEADISWTNLDTTAALPGPADSTRLMTANQKMDWFGTLRGRLGYTLVDQWLAYVTGGLAYGHASLSTALTRPGNPFGCNGNNCQSGSVSDTKVGWTIGGGLEWAFANHWSVKAEYLYFDLGGLSHQMTDPEFPTIIFNASADFKGSIARVGLNYQFH
jgi:outer membrane immunogenic protein